MMKKGFVSLLLLASCLSGWSQAYQKTTYGVKTTVGALNIELHFYTPNTIRAIKYPVGGKNGPMSFSVIAKPSVTAFTVVQEANGLLVQGATIKVRIDGKTGALRYYSSANKLLLAEKENGSQFTPVVDVGEKTFAVSQAFAIPANEALYGLGQHQQGVMNHRNHSVELRQQNMDIAVPFIQSSAGYGIFWDNASTTLFKDEGGITTLLSEIGDCTDYYFMNGGGADGVIAQMRLLTGNAPMFPRWVYGFFQSRERYRSQAEVLDIVKKYRDLQVPLDGIVQDWQYWGTNDSVWNAVAFGNPLFPQPKQMMDSVHALHAQIIISVWPSFGPRTAIHQSLQDAHALFDFKTWPTTPGVQVYDPFNPQARAIYWDYMNRNIFSLGMDGWWLDATEPEQSNRKMTDNSVTHAGSFKKVANAFPLLTTGGVYDHQRKQSTDKRVFIMTRSAFAGQQRYGTATWSGDIQGNWQSFRNQVSGGLNLSLSAIPYWNTDIGGFFTAAAYPLGVKDAAFHELYTRWLEFATFTPLFRSHGTNTPREIFQFGKKGDWAYDAQEKFIHFRYRLLPYIYSTSWQVTARQSTMMRALVMDFAHDEKVLDINNEYLFGKAFLVAPITDSMYISRATGVAQADFHTVKSQPVYLPKGSQWIDFWNGETHASGSTVDCKAPIDEIPLFVKAGSIVPFGPYQQYTSAKNADSLEIRIYPGANGSFTLYEDENNNYNYEKGIYSTIELVWNDKTGTLTIGKRKGAFPGMLRNRVFNVVVVGKDNGVGIAPAGKVKAVKYSGERVVVK